MYHERADPTKDIAFALFSYDAQPPDGDPKLRTPTLEETVSTLGIGADFEAGSDFSFLMQAGTARASLVRGFEGK